MQEAHLSRDTVGMIISLTVGRLLHKGIVVPKNHDEWIRLINGFFPTLNQLKTTFSKSFNIKNIA